MFILGNTKRLFQRLSKVSELFYCCGFQMLSEVYLQFQSILKQFKKEVALINKENYFKIHNGGLKYF